MSGDNRRCFLPVNLFSIILVITSIIFPSFSTAIANGQFEYYGFVNSSVIVDGAAVVLPGGLLLLSNNTAEMKGHVFHRTPIRLRKSPNTTVQSFSSSLVFGIIPPYTDLGAHGMTFFVAPSSDLSTALASQFLGLFNNSNNGDFSTRIFAVEIDTILNTEFEDIDDNHIGINICDLHSVASHPAGYYDNTTGGFRNLSLISGEAMQIWIDYDGVAKRIDVALAPFTMAKPTKPLLSVSYDLSAVLTDVAYVGLSAATGTVGSSHYVQGWSFSMNGPTPPFFTAKLPDLPRIARKASRSKVLPVIVPIATATFVFLVTLAVFLFVRMRLKFAELREDWEIEFGPHRLSFKDLYFATEGFKNNHLLGTGGFERVYKGFLSKSKLQIAVKKVSHESSQGIREFVAEVVSIGRLRHRNIVKLLGYCRRKGELLLVYDYMPNGSLDKYLYGRSNRQVLDWVQRFRIIKGVASGLLYLHGEWEQIVIHRDVKASNVLLDEEMNARLGDFGLARLYDHGTDMQTTHLVGTIGYLAPELVRRGKASPLTDVFAFGIFALEVTCGRRPIEHKMNSDKLLLVDWVIDLWHRGSILEAMDPRLQSEYNDDEAFLALKLGLLCSHPLPTVRPSMWHVMQYLKHDLPFPEVTPADMMQNRRVDSPVPYCQSVASNGTITMSGLSGGR
uniref:non-specific serine/threonine protein kinase n=1 Tax=Leersia perrieri TaxID=77586 RepID=A0A0D9WV84_9ORYZ